MNAYQLDREIDALKQVWRRAAIEADSCNCSAWNESECGCGGYIDTLQYVLRREVEYLRALIVEAGE